MDCIDPATQQVRPESGCGQMISNLNSGMSLADAVIARWFSGKQQTGEIPMGKPYVIIEQTVVEDAESPKDAIAKHAAGQGEMISINAQVRPQPGQQPQQQARPQPPVQSK
jgi:hypothetical protein